MTDDICNVYVPANQAPCGILPGSGIVGRSVGDGAQIEIWYEGNAHGALNLDTFVEKISCAAGRMSSRYPTSARAVVKACELVLVGEFHLAEGRAVIREVDLVSKWSGEEPAAELLTSHGLTMLALHKMSSDRLSPGSLWARAELARLNQATG